MSNLSYKERVGHSSFLSASDDARVARGSRSVILPVLLAVREIVIWSGIVFHTRTLRYAVISWITKTTFTHLR